MSVSVRLDMMSLKTNWNYFENHFLFYSYIFTFWRHVVIQIGHKYTLYIQLTRSTYEKKFYLCDEKKKKGTWLSHFLPFFFLFRSKRTCFIILHWFSAHILFFPYFRSLFFRVTRFSFAFDIYRQRTRNHKWRTFIRKTSYSHVKCFFFFFCCFLFLVYLLNSFICFPVQIRSSFT